MDPPLCDDAHTWRLDGAALGDDVALAWWACTRCPAVTAGPPGSRAPDATAWPDWWVLA